MEIFYSHLDTDSMALKIYANAKGVIFIESQQDQMTPFDFPYDFSQVIKLNDKENEHSIACKRQLLEYFSGHRQAFNLPIDLIFGTPFQQEVWQSLVGIPYGKTATYTEIAQVLNRPKANRSVATAIAKNPLLIIFPCHRVIRKNGELGGYRCGLAQKQALLELEESFLHNLANN